jgi:dTDP-4-dehydrorhamnose reductase
MNEIQKKKWLEVVLKQQHLAADGPETEWIKVDFLTSIEHVSGQIEASGEFSHLKSKNVFLVLGSTGMLGQALVKELLLRGKKVIGVAQKNTDFNIDITSQIQLIEAIKTIKPDVIINAAAIVDLSYCQENTRQCYLLNAKPSAWLSRYCANHNLQYVYISTDHYFSGDLDLKHNEHANTEPRNWYALTKYMGEQFTRLNPDAMIVRTNIVGFRHHNTAKTFVEWAIQSIENRAPIILFDDYYTSSIDVKTFSSALCDIISQNVRGIINIASSQVASKKVFIEALAARLNLSLKCASTGSVTQINDGIERNESLGLDVTYAEKLLGYSLPALKDVINNLANEYSVKAKNNEL